MVVTQLEKVVKWENLLLAYHNAAKGKRGKDATAAIELRLTDHLLMLQEQISCGTYRPGTYRQFTIKAPKLRLISAAPFKDRIVHHALCQVTEPAFEKTFIHDSYANRRKKGTHAAINRFQEFSRKYAWVLRADIQQHFASIDHAVLTTILQKTLPDPTLNPLINTILESGYTGTKQDYTMQYFPGDDLLACCRPRGLPIGNLTSQFWSNCYMNPFDHFIKRELRCKAYLRYVDDFALFSDSKSELWQFKKAIVERLARFRLKIHNNSCQVAPTHTGIPWLGMVVYPEYKKLKARKARYATRHLHHQYENWRNGRISYAQLNASIYAWINHAKHANTWRLRNMVLRKAARRH